MNRRAHLPGAAELFRSTALPENTLSEAALPDTALSGTAVPASRAATPAINQDRGSGRTRHDAKITVYLSHDELLALERARLNLRASYGLVADRGRLVREAVSVLLADLDEYGEGSVLVSRLRQEQGR